MFNSIFSIEGPTKYPSNHPITPPITEPTVQNNAKLNTFFGAASINPARNGSTGIGKIIDSIIEIKPRILSARDFSALCLAFSIKRLIVVF